MRTIAATGHFFGGEAVVFTEGHKDQSDEKPHRQRDADSCITKAGFSESASASGCRAANSILNECEYGQGGIKLFVI